MGYREDLRIDKYDLDEECVDHSLRYEKWGEAHVEADLRKEKAERRIKVIEAEVDEEIRENPKKYGWEEDRPPTEPFIKAAIMRHPRVKAAYDIFYRSKGRAAKLKVAVRAFEHRKRNLSDLCGLHNKQYYSRPYVPSKYSKEEKEELEKEVTRAQEEALELWQQEASNGLFRDYTGGRCSVCEQPQFMTPGGVTCPDGHGGAPSLEETEDDIDV